MSSFMGLLSPQQERRSRSKSPGGRERERSRSNVREEKPDPKKDSNRRKSSRKQSSSESGSDDDRRYKEKRSSKRYDDSDSDGDRRKSRSSRGRDVEDVEYDRVRPSGSRKEEKYSRRRSDSSSSDDSLDRSRSKYSASTPNIVTAIPTSFAPGKSTVKSPVQVQAPHSQVNAWSYASVPGQAPQPPGSFPERPHGAMSETRHMSYAGNDPRYAPNPSTYAAGSDHYRQRSASNVGQQYAQVGQFQYAKVDPYVNYKDPAANVNVYGQPLKPQVISADPRHSDSRVSDKRYAEDKYGSISGSRDKHYNEDKYLLRSKESDRKERKLSVHEKDDDRSSARRLSRLSIGAASGTTMLGVASAANHGHSNGHGKPPASPLLEAYQGTYQSISPMPSALVLYNHKNDSDISDVELDSGLSSDSDHESRRKKEISRLEKERKLIQKKRDKEDRETEEYERRRPGHGHGYGHPTYEIRSPDDDVASSVASARSSRKKVTWYDAEGDAKEIAAALKGTKPPNLKPLLRILPFLNMDDLDALKAEYKNHATIGGQGINMSKHIKARVTGHFGKAAYATSLGQYESDAYWANCFYQSGASRRELLIESLVGRTNQQIREIKNFFKDKKYDDDLEKCLKAELKADKFRSAILLALEEKRMAESPMLDKRMVRHDVQDLYEALNSAGGESAMIKIILVRSDIHLREVLRQYEREYGRNFARDMIEKSRNLVGETLAHVLNGALNRSMRDALLLHQAIAEMAPGKERAELLISRLVRLHWEPKHFHKVKTQYAEKYGIKVEDAIKRDIQSQMKTEEGIAWTNFCIALIRSSD